MCAIVDANSSGEIVATNPTPAARAFKEFMVDGPCCLVVGGTKLRGELGRGFSTPDRAKQTTITEWVSQIQQAGRLKSENDAIVDARCAEIKQSRKCRSDDPHIIALADISGARLLYSKDNALRQDFSNPHLINNPRGKTCPINLTLAKTQNWLRRNKDLCTESS